MKRATNLLGKQMLLARRLCEAGCGFVTVSDCGWDMHANGNSPKKMAGMLADGRPGRSRRRRRSSRTSRHAAWRTDPARRDRRDGPHAALNKDGGRDHYGNLTPLLLAGGGLKMGQVIGQSTSKAGAAADGAATPRRT